MVNKKKVLTTLKGGLIVSCQAEPPEPLAKPEILAALAQSAVSGGAVGIRANLPLNIQAIRKNVKVPVIGIYKKEYQDSDVFITPTKTEVLELINSEADIIAIDATIRSRPFDEKIIDLLKEIKESGKIAMADISTFEEGIKAAELGFDIIATTLSGYTDYTKSKVESDKPDFELIENLHHEIKEKIPVIAEGRIWTTEQAQKTMDCGAFAIVIGSAITRPHLITKRFVDAIRTSH